MLSHRLTIDETHGPVSAMFKVGSVRMSFPVAEWVDRLGGYVGEFTDPDDPTFVYLVSLEEWRSRDPDRTWLTIRAYVRYRLRRPGLGRTGRSRRGQPRQRPGIIHSLRVLRPR